MHKINLHGKSMGIKVYDNFYSFRQHADKHIFMECRWKSFLGNSFNFYLNSYDRGNLDNNMYARMYSDLVFPELAKELDSCLNEPLFAEYIRRRCKSKAKLDECIPKDCISIIGQSGLSIAIEGDILKTAFFPNDNVHVSDGILREWTFRDSWRKFRSGRVYKSESKGKTFYIRIERTKWYLSEFWTRVSIRMQGKNWK